jgi:hypothetical protein
MKTDSFRRRFSERQYSRIQKIRSVPHLNLFSKPWRELPPPGNMLTSGTVRIINPYKIGKRVRRSRSFACRHFQRMDRHYRRRKDNARRHNDHGRWNKDNRPRRPAVGEAAKTMVEDTKPLAESQKHWRSHNPVGGRAKNIGGDTKLFAERQNQSAKPCRPWSETIAILLNNKMIRRRTILPMVGKTLPLVEDTTMLAEKQRRWSKT